MTTGSSRSTSTLHRGKTTKITLRMVRTVVNDDGEQQVDIYIEVSRRQRSHKEWYVPLSVTTGSSRSTFTVHRGKTTKIKLRMVRTVVNDNGEQQVYIGVWRRRTHQKEWYRTVVNDNGEQQVYCTSREDDIDSDVWTVNILRIIPLPMTRGLR